MLVHNFPFTLMLTQAKRGARPQVDLLTVAFFPLHMKKAESEGEVDLMFNLELLHTNVERVPGIEPIGSNL